MWVMLTTCVQIIFFQLIWQEHLKPAGSNFSNFNNQNAKAIWNFKTHNNNNDIIKIHTCPLVASVQFSNLCQFP